MAKLPMVMCPCCKERFYREDEPDCVHEKNRYYHYKCYQEKHDKEKFTEYIHEYCKQKYGSQYSKRRITQQINELLADGKTLKGIYYSLVYWYDVKNNDISKSHGSIRIINYIYDEANQYYLNKWRIEQQQAQFKKGELDLGTDIFYISSTPIKKPKRVKLFDIH